MYKPAVPITAFLIILLLSLSTTVAEIVVYDDVVPVSKTIKLNALTKGRFLPEGGRLVKFYFDGEPLGANLSGGDGNAFFTFTPSSPGIFKLKAESGNNIDEGALLVTVKNDRILLIELEVLYEERPFSSKPAKDSTRVLQTLSKDYRILYLTTMNGIGASRKAIRANNFPMSPVIKWEGADLIDALKKKGITPYAIIASPSVISDAMDVNKRYSFRETGAGIEVKDWNDLYKHLDRNKAK